MYFTQFAPSLKSALLNHLFDVQPKSICLHVIKTDLEFDDSYEPGVERRKSDEIRNSNESSVIFMMHVCMRHKVIWLSSQILLEIESITPRTHHRVLIFD